jgi:hypothetical protein
MVYLRSYYARLNVHSAFRQALKKLEQDLKGLASRPPKEEQKRATEAFAQQWKLPEPEGLLDLRYSLSRMRDRPVRLGLRPRAIPMRAPVTVDTPLGLVTLDFDPSSYSSPVLRRLFRQLSREARSIAASAHSQLGVDRLPARHRRGELERLADRVFKRAVLGLSWAKIAASEASANVEPELSAIRASVTSTAKRIGVPLLSSPRGGRHRRSR